MSSRKRAGVILYHPKKRILLILRDNKKSIPFPNMWTLPGGHGEKGESPLEIVKREVWEEIRYKLINPRLFCARRCYSYREYLFTSKINKSLSKLKLGEGQKMAFIPFNQIDKIKIGFWLNKIIKKFINDYKNFNMTKSPEWIYPLYKPFDKKVFTFLVKLGQGRISPKIIGTKKEISEFIKLLIVTQKMKKYRLFRDIVLKDIQCKGIIDAQYLIEEGKKLKIPKGIDKSWAIFRQDQRLCILIDKLVKSMVEYIGNKNDIIEFISRFLLTQLLQDWRGPKMMVVKESIKSGKVSLKKLNKLLRYWDFTGVFK